MSLCDESNMFFSFERYQCGVPVLAPLPGPDGEHQFLSARPAGSTGRLLATGQVRQRPGRDAYLPSLNTSTAEAGLTEHSGVRWRV